MSIILYHRKTEIPNHLNDCIAKIRQYSKLPIYLITDSAYSNSDIEVIDSKKYQDLNWLDEFYAGTYYRNDKEYHMWKESSYRFFFIHKLMEEKNLSNILTFDNDVLIYENPEKIIELISQRYNGFAITPQCDYEVVMGMCFIKTPNDAANVSNFFSNEYKIPQEELKAKYKGYPTEMRILAKYNEAQYLPILPNTICSDRYSNNFNHFNSIFDPAGYGMYIGGLSPLNVTEPTPGWFHDYQEIGKHLKANRIRVIFEDRNPYLILNGTKIKINNLHIHSKQTYKYM
jgi:hypothetical protein